MRRYRFQHFLTHTHTHPRSEVELLRVLLRAPGELENKWGPDSTALISNFLLYYLRLFLTKVFFLSSFDYYVSLNIYF